MTALTILGLAWAACFLTVAAMLTLALHHDRRTPIDEPALYVPASFTGCTCPGCDESVRVVQCCIDYMDAETAWGLPDAEGVER